MPGRCTMSKRKSSISSEIEPAKEDLVQIPVRLELRDGLVVRPQVEVGLAVRRPRRLATQQVVPERAQRLNHRRQLEDMRKVVPLRPLSLRLSYAAGCWCPLSSGSVRIAATAMLLASVVSTARWVGSKVLNTGSPVPPDPMRFAPRWAAERRQQRRELSIALHEAASRSQSAREVRGQLAWFMTRINSEEAPCRPKGTTFHSCERKLVFHRSEARTRW